MSTPDHAQGGTVANPTLVTPTLLRGWALPEPGGSKYGRGLALVIGGAPATPGAAMLGGIAALRVGAGRLSLAVGRSTAPHVAVAVPESGVVPLDEDGGRITGQDADEVLADELKRSNAVLCGPGLNDAEGAVRLVEAIASNTGARTPVVLDAYALGVLPQVSAKARAALAGRLVLTPNTGELAYVLGVDDIDDGDEVKHAVALAKKFDATVSCSGWIVSEGKVWRKTTGDSGLGTSGSGDVMAGAILGLLSRGATCAQAAVWGTHLHAAAGDVLAARIGRIGFLASELLPELTLTLSALRGS